jgi:hypothetical protein
LKRASRTKKGIRASAVSTSMAVLLEGPLMKRSTGTVCKCVYSLWVCVYSVGVRVQ